MAPLTPWAVGPFRVSTVLRATLAHKSWPMPWVHDRCSLAEQALRLAGHGVLYIGLLREAFAVSLLVCNTAATLLGTFMLAFPAAYLLARKKFPGRGALFLLVLFALAIPGVVLLLPQYQEIAWLGLINTRFGLVVLYVAANVPLAVFFLRPAFASVPEPLVESMRVEGMSGLGIFRRLVLPLSSSTIIAVSVFVIVAVGTSWRERR